MPRIPDFEKWIRTPAMARILNGTSHALTLNTPIKTANPITMATWLYSTGSVGFVMGLGSGNALTNARDFTGIQITSSTAIQVQNTVGTSASAATNTFSLNKWHHIVGRISSDTLRSCWVNGVKGTDNTTSRAISAAVTGTMIGCGLSTSGTNGYMTGRLFMPCFWSVALTDGEIKMLARGVPPWLIQPKYIIGMPMLSDYYDPWRGAKWLGGLGSYVNPKYPSLMVNADRGIASRYANVHLSYDALVSRQSPLYTGNTPSITAAWNAGATAVTSSFVAPANSLLVTVVSADTGDDTPNSTANPKDITMTVTDSSGTLTWTKQTEIDKGTDPSGNYGHISIHTAPVPSQRTITVTATRTQPTTYSGTINIKTYIVTGHYASSPIGNVQTGYSTSNIVNGSITTTAPQSLIIWGSSDWSAQGYQFSNDSDNESRKNVDFCSGTGYKNVDDVGSQSFQIDAENTSSTLMNWAAIEIRSQAVNTALVGSASGTSSSTASLIGTTSLSGSASGAATSTAALSGIRLFYIDVNTNNSVNADTTATVNLPGTAQANDLVVFFIVTRTAGATVSGSGSGWSAPTVSTLTNANGNVMYKTLTSGDISTGSVSCSISIGSPWTAIVVIMRGHNQTTPVDGSILTGTWSNNTVTFSTMTTANDGDIILYFAGANQSAGSIDSYTLATEIADIGNGGNTGTRSHASGAYLIVPTAGTSPAASITSTGSTGSYLQMAIAPSSGTINISGSVTGTSSQTGSLIGSGSLAASGTATSSQTGALNGAGDLSGSVTCSASSTAALTLIGSITASISCSATSTAALTATGTLAGSVAGSTSTNASVSAIGTLAAALTCTVTSVADLIATGALTGSIACNPSSSATLVGTGNTVASSTGIGTSSATLTATGTLTASLVASATSTAFLETSNPITGAVGVTSTISGTVTGIGEMTATSAGVTSYLASLIATGALAATGITSASSTAAISASGLLAASSTNAASSTASLTASGTLAATLTVVASSTANLIVYVPIVGSAVGTAIGSASSVSSGSIAGTSTNQATSTATISGLTSLTGSATGVSTLTSAITGDGTLQASITSVATVSGIVLGSGSISGSSAGVSDTYAIIAGSETGIGDTTGTATCSGSLTGSAALSGTISSTSTVSATVIGIETAEGSSASAATLTGTLTGTGSLAASLTTITTVSGTVVATGTMTASSTGLAAASAALTGKGTLTGSTSGSATCQAETSGNALVSGAITGSCSSISTLVGSGSLAATSTVTSSSSAFLRGLIDVNASASGQATAAATITATNIAAGLSTGTVTIAGSLTGTGNVSSTLTCNATISGTMTGWGSLVGAGTSGVTLTGSLTGNGSITSSISSPSTVSATLVGYGQLDGSAAGSVTVIGSFVFEVYGEVLMSADADSELTYTVYHSASAAWSESATTSITPQVTVTSTATLTGSAADNINVIVSVFGGMNWEVDADDQAYIAALVWSSATFQTDAETSLTTNVSNRAVAALTAMALTSLSGEVMATGASTLLSAAASQLTWMVFKTAAIDTVTSTITSSLFSVDTFALGTLNASASSTINAFINILAGVNWLDTIETNLVVFDVSNVLFISDMLLTPEMTLTACIATPEATASTVAVIQMTGSCRTSASHSATVRADKEMTSSSAAIPQFTATAKATAQNGV